MASNLICNGRAAASNDALTSLTSLTFILIAPSAHSLTASDTKNFLSNALHIYEITSLHIFGPSSSSDLQALRTEAYSVAGKLARNLSVTLHELPENATPAQISSSLEPLSLREIIHGTLLILPSPPAETATTAITTTTSSSGHTHPVSAFLALPPATLQTTINHNLILLHAIARLTTPSIPSSHSSPLCAAQKDPPTAFFTIYPRPPLATPDIPSSLPSRLQDLALDAIRASAPPHMAVGYAEEILCLPDVDDDDDDDDDDDAQPTDLVAIKVDEKFTSSKQLARLGMGDAVLRNGVVEEEDGESPTKLWAEWAALEEEMS